MTYDLRKVFTQVIQYLEARPSMSLTQISSELGVERHTIEKAIKNGAGVTFREFRTTALLKHAKTLFNGQQNRTVKEVAFTLGYRSQGSLSRFIRSTTGRSVKELMSNSGQQ